VAVLFIPVFSRVSTPTETPLCRLLISMGFCAMLGGTLTLRCLLVMIAMLNLVY
jgi:hypothetical protein